MSYVKITTVFLLTLILNGCGLGVGSDNSSVDDESGANKETLSPETETVENFISRINDWTKKLTEAGSLDEFDKIEKEGNEQFIKYSSSSAPLNDTDRNRLVDAIVNSFHQSYLHRIELEDKVLFKDEANSINELLENIKLDFQIKAQNSSTLGEFLNSLQNN